jgi:hypothetical protein
MYEFPARSHPTDPKFIPLGPLATQEFTVFGGRPKSNNYKVNFVVIV